MSLRMIAPRRATPWREHHNRYGRPKLPWHSEAAALAHANSFDDANASAYQCGTCNKWHVGTSRPAEHGLHWMVDEMVDILELGERVAAQLRREQLTPWGAIQERHNAALRRLLKSP